MLTKMSLKILVALLVGVPANALARDQANDVTNETLSDFRAWEQAYFLNKPFVQDAIRRWAEKGGESVDRLLEQRDIQLMNFPDKVCVQFAFKVPAVGGVPVYCYVVTDRENGAVFDLIEEFSDVE